MKRWIGLATAVVLALAVFYGAWPAWSAYVIRNAIQARDPAALASKVDFTRVRDNLRPVLAMRVDQQLDKYQAQLGTAGRLLAGRVRKDVAPRIVDASVNRLVTPEVIIRIVAERAALKETIEAILREQIGLGIPDAREPSEKPAPDQEPGPANPGKKYSLANIKRLAFSGPLSFQLGVAKDPAAPQEDFAAEMAFTGGDWKLVGLVPRL